MDLVVKPGEVRRFDGDVAVAGWVTVAGTLDCGSELACLGISIESGGEVRCTRLVANVVELDNLASDASLDAGAVKARVVSIVQVTDGPLADLDCLDVDYIHHYAGDLNPSFDYEHGKRSILGDHVTGDDPPLEIDITALRTALCAGKNPFTGIEVLVQRGATAGKQVGRDPLVIRTDPPRPSWLDEVPLDATEIDDTEGRVTEIPPAIARYTELERIQLAYNRIARLPPELCRLPNLVALDVQSNRLTALPDEIDELASLEELCVDGNPLTALPASICRLANLRELSIGYTEIAELPADFGQLVSLRYLNLHDCPLSRLPESFFTLPKLDSIYLHGTQLSSATLARLRLAFPNANYWNFTF